MENDYLSEVFVPEVEINLVIKFILRKLVTVHGVSLKGGTGN